MALLLGALYGVIWFDACGTDQVRQIASPGGRHKVVLFRMNCGATTAYSTQAVILPGWGFFLPRINEAFMISDEADPRIVWRGEDKVEVILPKNTVIYRRKSDVDGVAIAYR